MDPKLPYNLRKKLESSSASFRLREPFNSLTCRSERSPIISNNIRNRRHASRMKTCRQSKVSRHSKTGRPLRDRVALRGASALYTSRDRPSNFMASLRQIKLDKKKDRSANLERSGLQKSKRHMSFLNGTRNTKRRMPAKRLVSGLRLFDLKKNKSQLSARYDLIWVFISGL